MDAKKYFESTKGCQKYIFGKAEMIEFAEAYHAERSKEETYEMLNSASYIMKEAARITSGKEEI